MIQHKTAIHVKVAQTRDVAVAEATWLRTDADPEHPWHWHADGSSKRAPGDKRNPALGRDLAVLRALRKLVARLEASLPAGTEEPSDDPVAAADLDAFTAAKRPIAVGEEVNEAKTAWRALPFDARLALLPPLLGIEAQLILHTMGESAPVHYHLVDLTAHPMTTETKVPLVMSRSALLRWLEMWQAERPHALILAKMIDSVKGWVDLESVVGARVSKS